MSKELNQFILIGRLEAISFLILLLVAMPMKYMMDMPLAVTYFGWIHGLLFMIYLYLAMIVKGVENWNFARLATAVVAALLPFGPFIFERKLKRAS